MSSLLLERFGVEDVSELFSDVLFPATFLVIVGWASLVLVPCKKYPLTTVLVPSLILAAGYLGVIIYGMVNHLTSYDDFFTLEGVAHTFSQIEIALAALYHFAVMDLLVANVMALDFYTNYDVKPFHRLVFTLQLFFTFAAGPVGPMFYWVFRSTIMKSSRLLKPEEWYQPKTHWQILQEDLKDRIPTPHVYIDKIMPRGLRKPTYILSGVIGLACLAAMLMLYIPYLVFCILYYSLTRPLSFFKGFEGVAGKRFPTRNVVIAGAHLRLFWIFNRKNLLLRLLFGWWLDILLQFAFFMEYIPVGPTVVLYIDVLVEEFGPQFPMGSGIGFTTHESVKELIEDVDIVKGPNSLGWRVSEAQYIFSDKTTVFYPQIKQQRFMVKQGRQITRVWLADIAKNLRNPSMRAHLHAGLAYPNEDGSMVDKKVIEKAFMSSFFHLLTGGELTREEMDALDGVLYNPGPFLPSWFNFLFFGGILERKAMASYAAMRDAFLRYPNAPSLRRALALGDSFGWDGGETVRYLAVVFSIAGAVAPSTLCSATVERLYEDRSNLQLYESDKHKFIKETARLDNQVPLVNMVAYYDMNRTVQIKGKNYIIPTGTSLHASIVNANRDTEVFGEDARDFRFDRNLKNLNQLLSWNGTEEKIINDRHGDHPPRRCPGHMTSLIIVQFVVDRYKPPNDSHLRALISNERYNDINRRELSTFSSFLLGSAKAYQNMWNSNFPGAADALYPGDAKQKDLREATLEFGYKLPVYDEDEPPNPLVPLIQFTLRLGGSPQDYSGEFRSREEAIGWRIRWFGQLFPPAVVDYLKFNAVEQVCHLAFAGAACLRTVPVQTSGPDVPPGAVYVNDNHFLSRYKVRLGYQRYGARAYFDRNGDVVGIFTSFDGKLKLPSKQRTFPWEEENDAKEWQHAMWVWKATALAVATVSDHLCYTHLIESCVLAWATRKYLPATHPLRAFFKIFTYRTISINFNAASVLTIRRGHVERIWAFESDDLQQLFVDITDNYKYTHLPDRIDPGMEGLDDSKYPINHDLSQFWKTMRALVHDVFTTVYVHGPQRLDDDEAMQNCLDFLAVKLHLHREDDLTDFDHVVDVFTTLICSVTAYHEHVGQVSDYFGSPYEIGTTLREGKEQDSIQTYAMLVSLVCSTGLRVPRLLDSWDHLLQRDVFATETVKALSRCQAELEALSIDIDRRNKIRKFPMGSFNPRNMESSVSV